MSTKPDLGEIAGLDQVRALVMIVAMTTPNGRGGIANMVFRGQDRSILP